MKKLISMLICVVLLAGCSTNEQAPQAAAVAEDTTLEILVIGGYGYDSIYYLESLAGLSDLDLNAAFLSIGSGTLRDEAKALAANSQSCIYGEADGTQFTITANIAPSDVIDNRWDIIVLQQAVLFAGLPGTYNSDLAYIVDYIQDHTDAQIYWDMSWAADDGILGNELEKYYKYYKSDNALMYNAIVTALDNHITENPDYSDWIPTGAAIQSMRNQISDADLTANGHNLSFDVGRLTAALTLLKTIYPTCHLSAITYDVISGFVNTSKADSNLSFADTSAHEFAAEDLTAILAAVENACALDSTPALLATDIAALSENAHITPAQTTAPLSVYFPDLAVLSDGSIIIGAYENVVHYPTTGEGNMQEGVGRLVIWNSSDNGNSWHYDQPMLVIDEAQLEQWGIAQISNRYDSIKSGIRNYTVMADPRDPNLSAVMVDMDGDGSKDEVLLLTFWIRYYTETDVFFRGYMLHSTDGGQTWSIPQELTQSNGKPIMKRGNIAFFSDGQIFIPYYYGTDTGGLLMEYDPYQEKWVLLKNQDIPNMDLFEGKKFNEISLVVPNPESDIVYAYCRDNGTFLVSDNRGDTWEYLANEEGLIHQPGFAILDQENVFVTWSRSTSPRTVYGKVFSTTGIWEDTNAQIIYESPNTNAHDMGDPSCALLADGRVLVVAYDTTYRSIVGVYVDPQY